MRPSLQLLLCAFWTAVAFYALSRPPRSPRSFPEQGDDPLPLRGVYNPNLAAALDQEDLRDFWQKPDQVLEALGPLEGLAVADIGCGEGYFTLRLLSLVGDTGKVYATDIQQEVLDTLERRIPEEYRSRVELIHSDAKGIGIPGRVDLILLVQVLGEVQQRGEFLRQIRELMHQNTRLAIIDSKHITDPDNGFTRPLNLRKLIEELNQAGFGLDPDYQQGQFDFLPKQFFFVFVLADMGP